MSIRNKTIKLTLQAEEDLLSIYAYGRENWGIERAELFISALYDRFKFIANNTEIGRKREEFYEGCRSWLFESYVIFYQIREGRVEIIGVVHEKKDILSHSILVE